MNGLQTPHLAFGSKLWLGLASYVLVADVYAMIVEKETLSDALYRGLAHPKRRWPVTLAWVFTTKHLFFRRYIAWLDPFAGIALIVTVLKKVVGGNK